MFDLDNEYVALAATARELADSLSEYADEADGMLTVHPQMRAGLQQSGLAAHCVPAQYGGRFETLDPLAIAVVREVLMGTSSHLDSLFALQGIGSFAITAGGSEAQREQWLPRVASGEALAGLGLTEPDAGSDLKSITTALSADGDALLLNGEKAYISNGGAAGLYTVLAREGDGYTMVFVPADGARPDGHAGPRADRPAHPRSTCLRDVVVRRRRADRQPGKGIDLVMATLSVFRVSVAGASLGLAQAALEEATRHAAGRSSSAVRWRASARSPRCSATVMGRARGRAAADLPRRHAGPDRPRRRAAPLLDGQARGQRDGRADRRSRRADHGPLGPGARRQDRAPLPPGASDAHLRGRQRGADRSARPPAGPADRKASLMLMDNVTALVTGGASGLGRATAKELVAAGAHVVLVDLPSSPGELVAKELDGVFAPADVTDPLAMEAALDQAEALGPLRVVVHCAGKGVRTRVVDKDGSPGSLEIFAEVVNLNLVGTFNVLRLAAARMARNEAVDGERGVVVLTASVAAWEGQIGQIPYASAKAGIVGMTLVAARDLASKLVRVCTIAPGVFDTPILDRINPEVKADLEASVPNPRRLGRPEEFGRLVCSIVANPYLNGEVIRLDGALRMGPR